MALEAQTHTKVSLLKSLLLKASGSQEGEKNLIDNKGFRTPKPFDYDMARFHQWSFKLVNWINGVFSFARAVMT